MLLDLILGLSRCPSIDFCTESGIIIPMASTPGETTPTPAETAPPTIVYRAITLRVDLRVLAAIGGALIIVGALLPWVTPVFEPFQRALRPTTTGSWPVVAIGRHRHFDPVFSAFSHGACQHWRRCAGFDRRPAGA